MEMMLPPMRAIKTGQVEASEGEYSGNTVQCPPWDATPLGWASFWQIGMCGGESFSLRSLFCCCPCFSAQDSTHGRHHGGAQPLARAPAEPAVYQSTRTTGWERNLDAGLQGRSTCPDLPAWNAGWFVVNHTPRRAGPAWGQWWTWEPVLGARKKESVVIKTETSVETVQELTEMGVQIKTDLD